jgi:hypothetical protein
MELINKAALVAKTAHNAVGQVRKFTGEPYWTHPEKVAWKVGQSTKDEVIISAAWLHDVVEDTQVSENFIGQQFGPQVQRLVFELTEQKPHDTSSKNAIHDIARLAAVSPDGKLLKLSDIWANISDIGEESGEGFIRAWLPTKIATVLAFKRKTSEYNHLIDEIIALASDKVSTHYPELTFGGLYAEGVNRLNKAAKEYPGSF